MRAHFFQPLRFDGGDGAPEQARGFHQFGAHYPRRAAAVSAFQVRARVPEKLDAARAQIFTALTARFHAAAHVAEQAREQAFVNGLVAGGKAAAAPFFAATLFAAAAALDEPIVSTARLSISSSSSFSIRSIIAVLPAEEQPVPPHTST